MKTIKCKCGADILLDDEDYEHLKDGKWTCASRGVQCFWRENGKTVAHNIAWSIVSVLHDLVPDHIDRNVHNNQKSNLRIATKQQNTANRGKWKRPCSSKYKGVSWSKSSNRWRAQIKVNYKAVCLGHFDKEENAALAYDKAAKRYFGEFACLNFIN